ENRGSGVCLTKTPRRLAQSQPPVDQLVDGLRLCRNAPHDHFPLVLELLGPSICLRAVGRLAPERWFGKVVTPLAPLVDVDTGCSRDEESEKPGPTDPLTQIDHGCCPHRRGMNCRSLR